MLNPMAAALLLAAVALTSSGRVQAQGYDARCERVVTELCADATLSACFAQSSRWDEVPDFCTGDVQSMIEDAREGEAHAADTDALASTNARDLEGGLYGYSYGGILRAGPDMGSARIASLQDGERIRILENTGIWMGEYLWYRVLTGQGEGFHWGGLFCFESDNNIEGILVRCVGSSLDEAMAAASGVVMPKNIVLRGDGVALANGAILPFGMPAEDALQLLMAAFETAPLYRDWVEDCGPGRLEQIGFESGFNAYFQQQRFVGWTSVDERTAEGIGFGSSRADVVAAYRPKFIDGSLGPQFDVNGLQGVMESSDADAQVGSVWAGMTCIMH